MNNLINQTNQLPSGHHMTAVSYNQAQMINRTIYADGKKGHQPDHDEDDEDMEDEDDDMDEDEDDDYEDDMDEDEDDEE